MKLIKTVTQFASLALRGVGPALLALLVMLGLAPSAWSATNETLTGSGSWTVPAKVSSVTVELWGAGGGGGAKVVTGAGGRGGGGGGGGYTRATISVTPGSLIAYSVGTGGAAGTVVGPADGQAGGSTTFTGVATAGGGLGGFTKIQTNTPTLGGTNGIGGTANGGKGENATATGQTGGAGGGAGGWTGSVGTNGAAGGSVTTGTGGIGGGVAPSQGGNGASCANNTVGATGGSPGGGGSGASTTSATTKDGGAGADGLIVLTYTADEPTAASSGMNFTAVGETGMTVNWTNGNGANRIVIAKVGSAPTGVPLDTTNYIANATYGSGGALAGGFVVYNGTGNSVTVSGLTGSSTYYFVVYEYNTLGVDSTINYLTSSSLSGNRATAAATTPTIFVVNNPVSLNFGNVVTNLGTNLTYTVSGTNLTGDISIAAPLGYSVSTNSGSGFGSTLTLTRSGNKVNSTTVYVRFLPTAFQTFSGNVTNSSAGAPVIDVAVTGNGIPYLPIVTTTGATDVTNTSLTVHGSIVFDGNVPVLDRGVYYGYGPGINTSSNQSSGSASWSTPGTYAWVCPSNVTSVQVQCWGGGGAGGWASRLDSTVGNGGAGGGAGGDFAQLNSYAVTPGTTYYVNVGAGGVSVITNGATGPGGDSWFNASNTINGSTLIARGGAGAPSLRVLVPGNTFAAGGINAGTSVGDVIYAGGNGGDGSIYNGGSGGGSGGIASAGINGTNGAGVANTQVQGAPAVTGGGPGGAGSLGNDFGKAPIAPPGGGGGGARSSATSQTLNGGSGAAGKVVMIYSGNVPLPIDVSLSGLAPNSAVYFKAYASNLAGTALSAEATNYTAATVPAIPTLSTNFAYSPLTVMTVRIRQDLESNPNPAGTQYAIQETNSGLYVQANNVLGAGVVWQTTNQWNVITNINSQVTFVSNLTSGVTYAFQVKARNFQNTETVFGPAAIRSTFVAAPTVLNNGPLSPGSTLILTATGVSVSGATNYTWVNGFNITTITTNNTLTITNVQPGIDDGTYTVTAILPGNVPSLPGNTTVGIGQLTTTLLTSSLNPSTTNLDVTFTATVQTNGVTATGATGNYVFSVDGAPVATIAVSGGSATYSTTGLAGGSHTIGAAYQGDSAHLSSSNSLVQNVRPFTTTTLLASSLNPSVVGQSVVFTATVQTNEVTATDATGYYTFSVDGGLLTVVTLSGGSASYTNSALAAGSHSVYANYFGSADYQQSDSYLTQIVAQPTTTALTSSLNPSATNQSVTFTATVQTNGVTASGAAGSYVFSVNNTPVATNALTGGLANYTNSFLAAGTNTIQAVYLGGGTYLPSTNSLSQVVTNAASATPTPTKITSVVKSGSNLIFSGTNASGTPGNPYYVRAFTNITTSVTNWPRISTNYYGAGGAFSVTNPINSATNRLFFRLEL